MCKDWSRLAAGNNCILGVLGINYWIDESPFLNVKSKKVETTPNRKTAVEGFPTPSVSEALEKGRKEDRLCFKMMQLEAVLLD
jgi:hypothetical protein